MACSRSISSFIKDPFPGISHWIGMMLAIVGLVILLDAAHGRPLHLIAFAIYGTTLVTLYFASAMTHSLHCSDAIALRLDQFDYAAIFLLIAGTYTPMCLIPLRGAIGWSLLVFEWLFALVGILTIARSGARAKMLRVSIYLVMAWMCLIALPKMLTSMPPAAIVWLIAGGIVYSLGAIVYVTNRPNLWPRRFVAHDLWHVMVMIGSTCHFIVMLCFLA